MAGSRPTANNMAVRAGTRLRQGVADGRSLRAVGKRLTNALLGLHHALLPGRIGHGAIGHRTLANLKRLRCGWSIWNSLNRSRGHTRQ